MSKKKRKIPKKPLLAGLRREIAIGMEEADRGDFVDGPRVFAEIRRRGTRVKRVKRNSAP